MKRSEHQLGNGGLPRRSMYLATVDSASSWPSKRNSACMRSAPHNGFSRAMRRIRRRTSAGMGGRPGRPHDFQAHQ
jgi:hypothetical protein